MNFGRAITGLREYLGLDRNVLVMTAGRTLKAFGEGLWSGYLPKVLEALGASAPMIGAFGTISAATATAFTYLGGAISDRLGRGHAMIFAAAVSLAGLVIYAVSPAWWLFIPASILLTASAYFSFMGSMALLGETVNGNRRAVCMASLGLISLPVALLAPPLGGVLIAALGMVRGFRVSVGITILLTGAGIWVQRRLYRLPPPAAQRMSLNVRAAWHAMGKPLRSLLLANCFMAFGSGMSGLFLVLYAMNMLDVSAVQFGLLQSVTIGSTSVLSIPVGKLADRRAGIGRKPYAALAFLLSAVCPIGVVLVPSGAWLWPVFALLGVRQTFDMIRKAMIIDLAGEGERGRVIGLYFFIVGAAALPAPFVAGWLWQWSPTLPFLVGGAVSTIGFLLFLLVRSAREPAQPDEVISSQ